MIRLRARVYSQHRLEVAAFLAGHAPGCLRIAGAKLFWAGTLLVPAQTPSRGLPRVGHRWQDAQVTRRTEPSPDQPPLLAVEAEQPKPTPNDLTKAWCHGYSQMRAGRQPHPNVVKRVGRIAKNIGQDCETLEDWRQAWRAALVAGKQGRWDITALLIDEQPKSLYPVKGAVSAKQAVLAKMLEESIPGEIVREIG